MKCRTEYSKGVTIMAILEVNNVKKIYTTRFGGNQVQALSNINFSVEKGEYVAIMGESGSGKTTLLNILAALDKPTSGEVLLNGKNLVSVKEKEISAFRRDHLGFVFQDFNLLDNFSLKDNIFLPLVLSGVDYKEMEKRIRPIAQKLGITELLEKYPYEVSGGQKQRAAVARALITNPELVLACLSTVKSCSVWDLTALSAVHHHGACKGWYACNPSGIRCKTIKRCRAGVICCILGCSFCSKSGRRNYRIIRHEQRRTDER